MAFPSIILRYIVLWRIRGRKDNVKTLIVDYAGDFDRLVSGPLRHAKTELVNATSGENAIVLANNEKYDCVCVSALLEDVDGIQLCKKLRSRAHYRYIPILLLTDKNEPELIKTASAAGVTDIFVRSHADELVNYLDRFEQIYKPIQGRVLYVEDDESQRLIIEQMLKRKQLHIDAFENAEDAWMSFQNSEYDLVITDIVLLGEMSGIMLINKIRRLDGAKGDTPILAITGYDDLSRRVSLYRMGINDYISKPVLEEELVSRVRNLTTYRKARLTE